MYRGCAIYKVTVCCTVCILLASSWFQRQREIDDCLEDNREDY